MESSLLRKAVPILIAAFCLVWMLSSSAPKVAAAYTITFKGTYSDDGLMTSPVNCTLWREGEEPLTFELDGEYVASVQQLPAILQIHLEYNESRTIYITEAGTYYVFVPIDSRTYYFQVLDFVGLENGYIETWLNVNGTLRLIERQTLALMNDIPFEMSWGYAYEIAIYDPDEGRAFIGSFTAKQKSTFLIGITKDLFPEEIPSSAGIYKYCQRLNSTAASFYYSDLNDNTNWVHFALYTQGSDSPIAEFNSTSEPVSWLFNDLDPSESYIGKITVSHEILGDDYFWSFILPSTEAPISENPFSILDNIALSFPIQFRYVPVIFLVLCIFMAFSWWNLPVGVVAGYLFAALFVYLGWLPITWSWMMISGSIGFLIAIILAKERESGIL